VPELVAEIEHAAAVVAGQRLVVLIEVGDVVHADRQPPLLRLGDVVAGGVLDLAEIARERHLLVVGQLLVVEDEDGVLVHAGLDGGDVLAAERLGEVSARDLADEDGMELADRDRHLAPPRMLLLETIS
jgi:hypothetical protein